MYRKIPKNQLSFENFYLPFGGKLNGNNRWIRLARIIPWDLVEEIYKKKFTSSTTKGAPAKSARLAFGALIIKERLGVSDEEAVEQIRENPYLQFFLGFHEFRYEKPFDPSMYVHFRKRFTLEEMNRINEAIALREGVSESREDSDQDPDSKGSSESSGCSSSPSNSNKGKLLMDATCAPADIRYPTDIGLVNEAREKSEEIIDTLFLPLKGKMRKPRTYRQKARKQYLAFVKKGKHSARDRRRVLGQQLRYLRRDLAIIDTLCKHVSLTLLSRRQYRDLLVIHELYRQQSWMYNNRSNSISDRIVSISQPHVRPIVRGKASAPTEFGSKLSSAMVDGFVFLDRLDWNPYNESGDLIAQIEAFRRRFGHYPESVHCDKIYRTRANRKFCKKHGIRMSGPPLGRPVKETEDNATKLREKALQRRQDELDRIPIEGKFGQGKRRFGLSRIMAKLAGTSETAIAIIFIVMNLEKWLKQVLLSIFLFLKTVRDRYHGLKATWKQAYLSINGSYGEVSQKRLVFLSETIVH